MFSLQIKSDVEGKLVQTRQLLPGTYLFGGGDEDADIQTGQLARRSQ